MIPATRPPRRFSIRHGFTLVELLVVIVIIVVLAAMVFVVTKNIRTRAYEANAVNTMRQMATFTTAYSTENNGNIHFLRDGSDPYVNWVRNSFWDVLKPYFAPDVTGNDAPLKRELELRLASLFNSKDVNTMAGTVLDGSRLYRDQSGLPIPFAFNRYVRGSWGSRTGPQPATAFKRIQSFEDPSQTAYYTYGFYTFNESDTDTYASLPNTDPAGTSNIYWFGKDSTPVLFLDGHLEMLGVPIPDRRVIVR
jgi:prepilin-type N-terminal cleavage/methylation domain-containing protein